MSDFYRFPAMARLDMWTREGQVDKILAEATEVMAEQFRLDFKAGAERRIAYGMELMDVIHAAETALRMEFDDGEVDVLRGCVEHKNRERGYYGE